MREARIIDIHRQISGTHKRLFKEMIGKWKYSL